MYVCLCNAIRKAEVTAAAAAGAATARAAYAALGRTPRCGKCLVYAQSLVRKTAGGRGEGPVSTLGMAVAEKP